MQHHLKAAIWRKSSHSGDSSCVEFTPVADGTVALRDSKHPHADALVFTKAEIDAFLKGAKAGEFDDLAV